MNRVITLLLNVCSANRCVAIRRLSMCMRWWSCHGWVTRRTGILAPYYVSLSCIEYRHRVSRIAVSVIGVESSVIADMRCAATGTQTACRSYADSVPVARWQRAPKSQGGSPCRVDSRRRHPVACISATSTPCSPPGFPRVRNHEEGSPCASRTSTPRVWYPMPTG